MNTTLRKLTGYFRRQQTPFIQSFVFYFTVLLFSHNPSIPLAMDNIQPISYRPLGINEIRLVALQPGTKTDTILCELVYFVRDDPAQNQDYEALSYTWGSPDKLRTITLDGANCLVRENLWWALHHLRKEDRIRRLWIDALCINQADIIERNQQVSQMDRIYKEAFTVAVWLGRESEHDKNALQYFWDIISKKDLPMHFDLCYADTKENDAWFVQHLDRWNDILGLCKRVYWTRLWIVQEFSLAKEIWIYIGDLRMEWRNLRDVIYCLANLQYEGKGADLKNAIASSPLTQILQGKIFSGQTEERQSMLELISHYRDSECFEIRDKTFGIHSLSKDCCRAAVPVDYSKTVPELAIGLLEHHLVQHGTEGFVSAARVVHKLFLRDQSETDKIETELLIAKTSSRILKTKVSGLYCSGLSYVSPSLDSLDVNFSQNVLSGKEKIYLSLALAYNIIDLDKYLETYGFYKTNTYSTDHLEKIHAANWSVSLEYPVSMAKMKRHMLDEPLTEEDHNLILSKDKQKTALAALSRVFDFARKMALGSRSASNCKLFLMPAGEIRLGPASIREGDWCCALDKFGPEIIVREGKEGKELETVGRAVPLLTDELKRSMVNTPKVSFELGFEDLLGLVAP
jgi:hypothetical protein